MHIGGVLREPSSQFVTGLQVAHPSLLLLLLLLTHRAPIRSGDRGRVNASNQKKEQPNKDGSSLRSLIDCWHWDTD